MKNIIVLSLLMGIIACTSVEKTKKIPENPTNIIFLIGDGRGWHASCTGGKR